MVSTVLPAPVLKAIAFGTALPTIAIAFGAATFVSQPSKAQSTTFFCGTSNGIPATLARTPRGEVSMILWNSLTLGESGDTLQKHCEEVSNRLQTYYNSGKLKYITTGKKNSQLVVCVAQEENGSCTDEPLFPLNSNDSNPSATLQRIFHIRVTSATPISETKTRIYINLEQYLNGEYPSLTPRLERTSAN